MNIHFQLRQQGKSNPIITLYVFDSRFEQRKFMYSTGISIEKSHWDKRKDRARLIVGREKEYEELNKYLDFLQQTVISFLSERHKYESLSRQELKAHILKTKINGKDEGPKPSENQSFFFLWERIIDETRTAKGESITSATKKQKLQTLKLVKKFVGGKGILVSFKTIDMNFYHAFDDYMKEKSLNGNSRGRHFKEIKAMLREAMDRDIEVNMSFQKKSFKVIRNSTDNTFLNDAELKKLIEVRLPSHLEQHRDVFVMACFVGARHSDWSQIRRSNIIHEKDKELLKIKQTKTGDIVHVPLHPVVRMILEKYKSDPPRIISNQKFNESIKDICKEAKLGLVVIDGKEVEKWAAITTHTARRSFATNAYLSKSLEVYQIMKCTGHKTESSFLAYLKLNGRDFALQAADSEFFKDDSWTSLKVAS